MARDLKDPASSTNRDGTVKENHLGTLAVCKCGSEFYLSFRCGFVCEKCKPPLPKITNELVKEVFSKYKGE